MKKLLLAVIWILIFLITSYDLYFAAQYVEMIDLWERNPIAIQAIANYGFNWVIAYRYAAFVLALIVISYATPRAKWFGLAAVTALHLYLATVYIQIYLNQPNDPEIQNYLEQPQG